MHVSNVNKARSKRPGATLRTDTTGLSDGDTTDYAVGATNDHHHSASHHYILHHPTNLGVLRATARPKIGANINLGCFYLMGMPVAVVLGFFMGFDFEGLWLRMLASQMCCVVAMLVVLGRTKWKLEAERAKQLMTWWIHIFLGTSSP
ncbi:hypothetical protein R6Q59_033859 [Mikania micrantha]